MSESVGWTAQSITYDTVGLVHDPAYRYFQKLCQHRYRALRMPVWQRFVKKSEKIGQMSGIVQKGDELVTKIRHTLDNMGIIRHPLQIEFHEAMIRANLPVIYDTEWELNYDRIMIKFKITKLEQEVLIICPRRFGKTTAVALFCASLFWNVPNVTIAILSTGKRTASKLMAQCLKFLLRIDGFAEKLTKNNSEEVRLSFGPFDERHLNSYPSSVKFITKIQSPNQKI